MSLCRCVWSLCLCLCVFFRVSYIITIPTAQTNQDINKKIAIILRSTAQTPTRCSTSSCSPSAPCRSRPFRCSRSRSWPCADRRRSSAWSYRWLEREKREDETLFSEQTQNNDKAKQLYRWQCTITPIVSVHLLNAVRADTVKGTGTGKGKSFSLISHLMSFPPPPLPSEKYLPYTSSLATKELIDSQQRPEVS